MNGRVAAVPAAIDDTGPHADPAARIAALFDAHHARLYRLARRLVRAPDDPSDVVQETFLRAARAPHKVPSGPASEEAWLVRVLINICKDSWRHAAVRSRALSERRLPLAGSVDPESGVLAHAMVWQALGSLPPRRRAIVVLHELEGMAIGGIARLLGITPVTVRWHLMIGRREMAQVLGDHR